MIGRLVASIRRFFSRRAARKLLAENLPRGLPEPEVRLLPAPPEPLFEPPAGEYWTLPLGAQAIRGVRPSRLLRLSALPPPLRPIDVVRPHAFEPLAPRVRLPSLLLLVPPIESRVVDLGVARPAIFRLDEELRTAAEREPLRVSSDARPLQRLRRVRPRTPIGRAPLSYVRPRNFRLDPVSYAPPNEGILPVERYGKNPSWWWIRPAFRAQYVDLPWMAQERIKFLGPMQTEWFVMWWDQQARTTPGGRESVPYELPRELGLALEDIKEQMLIRRDVKKDETPPEEQEYGYVEVGHPIEAREPQTDLSGIIPAKEWFEQVDLEPIFSPEQPVREVYLQWRTLVNSLEER